MAEADEAVKSLVIQLQSLNIEFDLDLAREFAGDAENREAIGTKFLPKMFRTFLGQKRAEEENKTLKEEKEEVEERATKAEEEKEKEKERATKAEEENKTLKEEKEEVEERATKAEKEKDMLIAEAEMAPFVERQLPPLSRGSRITAPSVRDGAHEEAQLTISKEGFGLLINRQLPMAHKVAFSLQSRIRSVGHLSFTTEASIVAIIEALLWEASSWLGQTLSIQTEYGIAGGRPDIVIIMGEHGTPVGAIEVKVPNADPELDQENPMATRLLHGQLLDYLLVLRQVYGVEHPLGIASTYTSWRFCWLPNSENFVKETREVVQAKGSALPLMASPAKLGQGEKGKLAAVPPFGTEPPPATNPSKEEKERLKEQRQENRNTSRLPRELCGTEVLAYNHPELPRHIVSFLHKLTYVKVIRRPITTGWCYPYIGPIQFEWAELQTLPVPSTFPPKQTQYFWLLSQLGAGQEGKAWKATTDSGATCAVKIFGKNADLVGATRRRDEELGIWKEVWEIKQVFSRELLERPALVMPLVMTAPSFGTHLPHDLPQQLQEATLKALERLDSCGYQDDDLAWRHVGFYKDHDGYKAVLLDIQKQNKTSTSLGGMKRKLGFG